MGVFCLKSHLKLLGSQLQRENENVQTNHFLANRLQEDTHITVKAKRYRKTDAETKRQNKSLSPLEWLWAFLLDVDRNQED